MYIARRILTPRPQVIVYMSPGAMKSFHIFLVFPFFTWPCVSWTVPTYMDLAWPPRHGDAYIYQNGSFLSPSHLDSCLNKRVPSNVSRISFPIHGSRLQFDLVNGSSGPSDESYNVDMYLPHLHLNSGERGTYKYRFTRWSPFENSTAGFSCSQPLNMTHLIRDKNDGYLRDEDLAGLDVTIALLFQVIRNYRVFEKLTKYVSFFNRIRALRE